jgi:multidrug resistance efflux pump
VFGGVVIVGVLVMLMNYNHPYSGTTREYFLTTPIIPDVAGTVISVEAVPNKPLKQGDPLFHIDPAPFQYRVDGLEAQLTAAELDYERARTLAEREAGPQRDADVLRANADELKARLADAEFELSRTVVRAPTDGYVSQLFLQPGMRAVNFPLRPVAVFVHDREPAYVAWFRQNSLLRLEVGHEAEIAFDGIPGVIFAAEVVSVLPVIKEGQMQPTGDLMGLPSAHPDAGQVPVVLKITDEAFEPYRNKLPGGAFGQCAVYSEHVHHVAIMRKILLRMASWLNYLFPIH